MLEKDSLVEKESFPYDELAGIELKSLNEFSLKSRKSTEKFVTPDRNAVVCAIHRLWNASKGDVGTLYKVQKSTGRDEVWRLSVLSLGCCSHLADRLWIFCCASRRLLLSTWTAIPEKLSTAQI